MKMAPFLTAVLLAAALAGCLERPAARDEREATDLGFRVEPAPLGGLANVTDRSALPQIMWPQLAGSKLTILAYSSFSYAFGPHAENFTRLTGAEVELILEDDSGKVLERAIREKGDPSFDLVYGIDNVLMGRALSEAIFEPYEPALAPLVDPGLAFVPDWAATPVNHGFIAVNVDPRTGVRVATLDDLREHAGKFVTEDPRLSTPGLGFLIATIATYGDVSDGYDFLDYWRDLFANGVAIAPDWTAAYATRFTGGYGQFADGAQVDKPIVTSYTTSPAYEMFYGYETLNEVVLAPKATFHQIQTIGIADGAKNRPAAQAFIEYFLTPEAQALNAPLEATYPVVRGVETNSTYAGRDPAPGSFEPSPFAYEELDRNVERWVRRWTEAYEDARA